MDVHLSQLSDVVARLERVQGQIGGVVISTGSQQCLMQDDTGERKVDVAQPEELVMALA